MDEGEPEQEKRFDAVLDRIPGWAVPGALLGIPAIMAIISLLSPAFYRNVVWKFYWGPIVVDGSEAHVLCTSGNASRLADGKFRLFNYELFTYERWGCTDPMGVAAVAGYNVVNTLTWVVLLFVCVIGIAQLLTRFKVPMDPPMIMAATAWVIAGSIIHVLQDAQIFAQPLEFLMITPPIWLLFGAFGVGSMVLGVYYRHIHAVTGSMEKALQKAWFHIMIFVLLYTALWATQWEQILIYISPIAVALSAVAAFFTLRWMSERNGAIKPWYPVMTFSIGWSLSAVVYYASYWNNPWPPKTPDFELNFAVWLVPALAGAVTGAVYLVARQIHAKGKENALAFMQPINLFLVFSQMMDAFSTGVGVDLSNYTEKHVLSESVRAGFESFSEAIGWEFGAAHPTFLGFAPVKLIVSLLVIYAIDVSGKEDTARMPTLMNLVKMAVIIVGIGPGVRNTLRMTIGI